MEATEQKLIEKYHAMPVDELDRNIAAAQFARKLKEGADAPTKAKEPAKQRTCKKCNGKGHDSRNCKADTKSLSAE